MDAKCHACIGGTNVRTDMTKLELGQHIVVGTPGRVFDMIQRKAFGTTHDAHTQHQYTPYIYSGTSE